MKKALFLSVSVFLLLSLSLASCSDSAAPTPSDGTDPVSTSEAVTEAETVPSFDPMIEAKDYGGAEFPFLSRIEDDFCMQLDDISAVEEDATNINDEIFRRNSQVMEKYHLKFTYANESNPSKLVRTSVLAGEENYQIVFDGLSSCIPLANDHLLYDLRAVPHVDLDRPYWSRAILEDISMYGKNPCGIGNLTTQAYFSSGIIYLNKQLLADFDLASPYEYVREGKWTYDRMLELCAEVSADLDGNGVYDTADRYGVTFNNFAWQEFFYGGGETFVSRDKDGALVFDDSNDRINAFIQKFMPISQNDRIVLYSEKFPKYGGNYRADVCRDAFTENRALFWLDCMYGVTTIREMETDFGILPVPKWDDAQENYASFIHTGWASSVVIPQTVSDIDRAGRVLEELCFRSDGVRDAFIEITLKGKLARDNDSADMIDIIINNIRTDYALLIPNFDSKMRTLLDKGTTDIASFYETNRTAFDQKLKEMSDAARGEE